MADPNLNKNYPEKDLNQVVAIAAMCLQEESAARPSMSDVVTALSFLSTSPPPEPVPAPLPPPNSTSQKSVATADESESENDNDSHSSDEERSVHEDNKSITAASAKHQEHDDVSDTERDYYDNENQHDYSSQDAKGRGPFLLAEGTTPVQIQKMTTKAVGESMMWMEV
jgi:type IV secretory pathway VirB10-like protein